VFVVRNLAWGRLIVETGHGDTPKGPTLASYIEDNHKLLTVLGVFTALTGYSANLPIRLFGITLSFCCMGIALLVLVQLWWRFPAYPQDVSTTLFKLFLFVAMLALFLYWLVAFTTVWGYALPIVVAMLTFSLLSTLALWLDKRLSRRRTDLASGESSTRGYTGGLQIIFLLACLVLSVLTAALLAPYLTGLLQGFRQFVDFLAQNR
jgi:hypothetical protein